MRYDTDNYARSRLLNTIVLYEGDPVEIEHVGDGLAVYTKLKGGGADRCHLSSLDLTPIRLGYFNHDGDAYYLKRLPKRHDWRQGLRGNNVNMPRLLNQGVVALCKGTYPPFERACSMVEDGHSVVAFSRQFAIDSSGDLEYRGNYIVGGVQNLPLGHTVDLTPEYSYLAEALKEAIDGH